MQKLSDIALETCAEVIEAIVRHPFNLELADGSLARETFAYYIEQDSMYLRDFARSLAMIASKAPHPLVKDFLSFSEGALLAEQEVVHGFFREKFGLQATGRCTSATLCYTNYLLRMSAIEPVEVAMAAVLPCFWVYKIVGNSMMQRASMVPNHPYGQWMATYSGQEFSNSVERAIAIFDALAQLASESVRRAMLEAFYRSVVFEWHFWNDAYHRHSFDAISSSSIFPKTVANPFGLC